MSRDATVLPTDGPDDLQQYLSDALEDPEFRALHEDGNELDRIIDSLVALRKALGLTQTDVARRMGVRQPTVSGFENEGSDPRLSTLQRYARAVEARLRLKLEMPAECDWVPGATPYTGRSVAAGAKVEHGHSARSWAESASARGGWCDPSGE